VERESKTATKIEKRLLIPMPMRTWDNHDEDWAGGRSQEEDEVKDDNRTNTCGSLVGSQYA
jgi:hypothetical protein